MSGSIIKLSLNGYWGTAFALADQGGLVFHTAAHVLSDLGFSGANQTKSIEMCDETFTAGPKLYGVTTVTYDPDPGCDVATFKCNFQARPFARSAHTVSKGDKIQVQGYLSSGKRIKQPACGVTETLRGSVDLIGHGRTCTMTRLSVLFATSRNHLEGMSGGPVTLVSAPTEVLGILNGAPSQAGGPPFVATLI